jgi:hypothetical protein
MSNIIETQTIVDGSRNLVVRAHIDGDGSGDETYTNLIDASSYTPAFTEVKLMRIDSNLIGFSAELTLEGTPVASGTTDGTTANKLVDSGASFDTDGTAVGMLVYNSTDATTAAITAIDSGTTLSVSSDIFVSGEDYEIGGKEHIWSLPDYQQNQCFEYFGGIPNTELTTPLGDISISTTGLGAGDTGHIMLYFKKKNNV